MSFFDLTKSIIISASYKLAKVIKKIYLSNKYQHSQKSNTNWKEIFSFHW